MSETLVYRLRLALVIAVGVALAGFLYSKPPIAQDPHYHNFADQRLLFGIPHGLNVLSNLPFLIVGLVGLGFLVSRRGRNAFLHPSERRAYLVFSIGVGLTAFGSAYYHLDPTNARLLWDRLPMSIAFVALFVAVIGERVSVRAGAVLLVPLILLGLATVVYGHVTEQGGTGDLRPYFLVQFYPMLALPLLLLLFPSHYTRTSDLFVALVLYALAKVFEIYDGEIYRVLGEVSGHTIKHLLSAGGAFAVIWMIMHRQKKQQPDA